MTFRFVSNIDGYGLRGSGQRLDPAETLFVVSSKDVHDFRDHDHAETARAWSLKRPGRR